MPVGDSPDSTVPTAAIILIGNELLSGRVDDVNGVFLIGQLRELGVQLGELVVIPDEPAAISAAVARVSGRFDAVFTSGGIGPTHDDLTIASVAAAFGVDLFLHEGVHDHIVGHFGHEPKKLQAWLKLANIPVGCCLLYNGETVWPVYVMRNVYMLPGIPEIFREQFLSIRDRFRTERFHLRALFFRRGEGELAGPLTEAARTHPGVTFGSYPELDRTDYRVKVTLESKDLTQLDAAARWLLGRFDRTDVFKIVDG